jgi:hypothetical protein
MSSRYVRATVCFLALVLVVYSSGSGATFVENKDEPFSFRSDFAQIDFERSLKMLKLTQSPLLAQETDPLVEEETVDIYGFKGKSLKRAFVYSLLIPGSGQLYAGSKIKTVVFLGLDAALWALYFNYHGKGKDKEDEYQLFADQHWSRDEYIQWLRDTYGIDSDRECYTDPVTNEEKCFSHHLPDSETDDYYEMIGKYEQFSEGWDDYEPAPDESSLNREVYLNMRRDSNDLLNKATYSAMFSLANHILSAFDAAISVRKYNKKGERFSQLNFKMRLVERDREMIPRLSMSFDF